MEEESPYSSSKSPSSRIISQESAQESPKYTNKSIIDSSLEILPNPPPIKSPPYIEKNLSNYQNIVWKKGKGLNMDICDICNNCESQELDAIYICDLCHCTAHQSCYGSELRDRNPLNDFNGGYILIYKENIK